MATFVKEIKLISLTKMSIYSQEPNCQARDLGLQGLTFSEFVGLLFCPQLSKSFFPLYDLECRFFYPILNCSGSLFSQELSLSIPHG